MRSILTIDVEDWFHIMDLPSTPGVEKWDGLPTYVERNFLELLDLISKHNVKTTCFFLAWVAQKFPHLVLEAKKRGHEIASHGYSHKLVYEMSHQEFLQDIIKAKKILEDITGEAIWGYRAPGFSITHTTPWFFNSIVEAEYRYDSSIFPGPRGHGGFPTNQYAPKTIKNNGKEFVEFPITLIETFSRPICFFGGGYLRLFPYFLIKKMAHKVLEENRPVIFYIHPREIDPKHPRLPMSFKRKFKSYINLKTTAKKIDRICKDFELTTFQQHLKDHPELLKN